MSQLSPRFERLPVVVHRTGLSRSSIYARVALGTFPRPIPLGTSRVVAWLGADVDEWIAEQVLAARSGRQEEAA